MTNKVCRRLSCLSATAAITAFQVAFCSMPLAATEPVPQFSIIPQPMKLSSQSGTFSITRNTAIVVDPPGKGAADCLAKAIGPLLGATPAVGDFKAALPPKPIVLRIDPALRLLGPEGYALEISPQSRRNAAAETAGLFYACQTLRQILLGSTARGNPKSYTIPCVAIEDRPQFPWRGLMLDPARHFLTKEFIKRYIDLLAFYKLNRLHLHLTDAEGWTLEIKRYPQLTDVSRWPRRLTDRKQDYYRQEDIREIVAYAAIRHVMVVPEIDIPGHNAVACTVLRELLLCRTIPIETGISRGTTKSRTSGWSPAWQAPSPGPCTRTSWPR